MLSPIEFLLQYFDNKINFIQKKWPILHISKFCENSLRALESVENSYIHHFAANLSSQLVQTKIVITFLRKIFFPILHFDPQWDILPIFMGQLTG